MPATEADGVPTTANPISTACASGPVLPVVGVRLLPLLPIAWSSALVEAMLLISATQMFP